MKIFSFFNSIWEKSSYWERFMSLLFFGWAQEPQGGNWSICSSFQQKHHNQRLRPQACCHPETTVFSHCSLVSAEGNMANVELIDSHKPETLIFSLLQPKIKRTKQRRQHKHWKCTLNLAAICWCCTAGRWVKNYKLSSKPVRRGGC